MRRKLPFITVGRIIDELKEEGLSLEPISLKRREKDIPGFPIVQKHPKDWRRYTRKQADLVKKLLKEYYKENIRR